MSLTLYGSWLDRYFRQVSVTKKLANNRFYIRKNSYVLHIYKIFGALSNLEVC